MMMFRLYVVVVVVMMMMGRGRMRRRLIVMVGMLEDRSIEGDVGELFVGQIRSIDRQDR